MIMDITEGMRVERVDYENDGTPNYQGYVERIERDEDEVTYWIKWDGAAAADPHGEYAFRTI